MKQYSQTHRLTSLKLWHWNLNERFVLNSIESKHSSKLKRKSIVIHCVKNYAKLWYFTSIYPNPSRKMNARAIFKYQKSIFSKLREEKKISVSIIINGFLMLRISIKMSCSGRLMNQQAVKQYAESSATSAVSYGGCCFA